jgi:DNA-directed RNA polymerase specialized sigma subunit
MAVEPKKPFDYEGAKAKDFAAWEQWKKTGSKDDLRVLIHQLTPVIYSEVHRASGSLPTTALALEAKTWAFKAAESYDPSKGTSLSTHVMNYLPKVRRLNYKFQNAVRLPENLQLKFHEYNKSVNELTDELNRDPTDEEVARKLGWSKPHVVKFRNSLYSDLIESASDRPSEFTTYSDDALKLKHIRDQLTPDEAYIFDNASRVSVTEAANHLKVNVNRYHYLRRKLIEKIAKIKQETGML